MFVGLQKKANLVFILSSILFFSAAIAGTQFATQYFVAHESKKVEAVLSKNLALVRSKFEANIFQDTYLADSLATVVTIDPDLATNHWKTIAQKLLNKANFVRNVGIAPNNIISMVYPLDGNEGAIGLDFRTKPEQLKSVLKAKQMKQVYIAGPLPLVQGGIGLIARYPIFSDYPVNKQYWGGVSVVMDYQKMISDTGLDRFDGASISLRKHTIDGAAGEVFYGEESTFSQADVEHIIRLPSGSWLMAAKFNIDELKHIQETKDLSNAIGGIATLLVYLMLVLHFLHYKQVHKASLLDELTQLPNRRYVLNLLDELTTKSMVRNNFALLNIDLNGFKRVNDSIGHQAGDELLKHVSAQLIANVRGSDTVARFGGDEFVVVLRGITNDASAKKIISKIQQAVEASDLLWYEQRISPSLSVGFTLYQGQETNVKQLLSDADKSMYQQKRGLKE
ncbi:sensor domain-containing diguanylate cyclase [Agarivorans sp. Toyoura001]|uniref:diguanylate cyclase n=1 Tax=Agarivorans sp. Toyoura001 TaxID=2283141 RepID=UPI0010D7B729|nr:diguanylate cyclase [Agarivorans sp. Toyoura001]GDY24596.1 sensor domain-containing diguanylate cyclase [Agarivorans sp. Toyoura001]